MEMIKETHSVSFTACSGENKQNSLCNIWLKQYDVLLRGQSKNIELMLGPNHQFSHEKKGLQDKMRRQANDFIEQLLSQLSNVYQKLETIRPTYQCYVRQLELELEKEAIKKVEMEEVVIENSRENQKLVRNIEELTKDVEYIKQINCNYHDEIKDLRKESQTAFLQLRKAQQENKELIQTAKAFSALEIQYEESVTALKLMQEKEKSRLDQWKSYMNKEMQHLEQLHKSKLRKLTSFVCGLIRNLQKQQHKMRKQIKVQMNGLSSLIKFCFDSIKNNH